MQALRTPENYAAAAVEGAVLGNFELDQHKSDKSGSKALDRYSLLAVDNADGLEAAAERGRVLAEAQNFARELGNEPPNRLTPRWYLPIMLAGRWLRNSGSDAKSWIGSE